MLCTLETKQRILFIKWMRFHHFAYSESISLISTSDEFLQISKTISYTCIKTINITLQLLFNIIKLILKFLKLLSPNLIESIIFPFKSSIMVISLLNCINSALVKYLPGSPPESLPGSPPGFRESPPEFRIMNVQVSDPM